MARHTDDGPRDLAVELIKVAIADVKSKRPEVRREAKEFLRCRAADEIMTNLGLDQDVVLNRLGLS